MRRIDRKPDRFQYKWNYSGSVRFVYYVKDLLVQDIVRALEFRDNKDGWTTLWDGICSWNPLFWSKELIEVRNKWDVSG